jgi:pyruvate kinase
VRVIHDEGDLATVKEGDILVAVAATPAMAPYLESIQALITEEGGLTSDAAIMGLNAGIPVIVGATDACSILKDGMVITIDTMHGKIYNGYAKVK